MFRQEIMLSLAQGTFLFRRCGASTPGPYLQHSPSSATSLPCSSSPSLTLLPFSSCTGGSTVVSSQTRETSNFCLRSTTFKRLLATPMTTGMVCRGYATHTAPCLARLQKRRAERRGAKRKEIADTLLADEDLFLDDISQYHSEMNEKEDETNGLEEVLVEEDHDDDDNSTLVEGKRQKRTIRGEEDKRFRKWGQVVVRQSDVEFFDTVRLEKPEALDLKVHTEDNISEAVTQTFITHRKIRRYAYSQESENERELADCVERLRDDTLGTCFYIRVVSLSDPTPQILTKCKMQPFVPFDERNGPAWEFGARAWRRSYHLPFFLYRHPSPTPSRLTPAQRLAADQIKQLLHLHFSTCVIEPVDGELSCDISLYAKYSVLSEKAAVYVRQFKKDLDDMLEEKYIKDFENYGVSMNPTPEQVEPLSPEGVALRMAAFFKSIIFSVGNMGGVDPVKDLRIVIGIARTAVQAKIACDTEVAVVLGDKVGLASQERQTAVPQLVRVRSFHKHFQSLEDEKNYIGEFPLHQIPVVNPQFSKFMKEVYQIEKVSQILEKQKELHFSFCRTTFEFCIRLAYGRMQFPHEIHTPLLSKNARHIDQKLLEECARNSISIMNENRTQVLVEMPRALYTTGKIQSGIVLQGQKSYGRLISNEKYIELAEQTAYLPISHLYDNHCSTAALTIEDRRSFRRVAWESVSFPRTTNPHMLIKIVHQLAEKMASQRKQTTFDGTDETYCFYVKLSQLESYNLLPRALEEDINAVLRAMKEGMEKRKLFRNSIRRITVTRCLYKPIGHRYPANNKKKSGRKAHQGSDKKEEGKKKKQKKFSNRKKKLKKMKKR